jgi:hypothetical protein
MIKDGVLPAEFVLDPPNEGEVWHGIGLFQCRLEVALGLHRIAALGKVAGPREPHINVIRLQFQGLFEVGFGFLPTTQFGQALAAVEEGVCTGRGVPHGVLERRRQRVALLPELPAAGEELLEPSVDVLMSPWIN